MAVTQLDRIEECLGRLEALIRETMPPTPGSVSGAPGWTEKEAEEAKEAAEKYIERRKHALMGVEDE